jgi:hypothetical protein
MNHPFSLRSSSSFLRLLPRLPVTSITPFIYPSITTTATAAAATRNHSYSNLFMFSFIFFVKNTSEIQFKSALYNTLNLPGTAQ